MKLVALLAWYDEPAEMLYDSLAPLMPHIDRLVAVDGAYPYYPDGRAESGADQYEAIKDAVYGQSTSWEIITPGRVWHDETEKRTQMFSYAACHTTPDDWYLVWDADFFLIRCAGVHDHLSWIGSSVATAELRSSPASREPPLLAHRLLFRAYRGIHCVGRHNILACPSAAGPVYLWGHQQAVQAADLTANLAIWHDPGRRSEERLAARETWMTNQGRLEAQSYAS